MKLLVRSDDFGFTRAVTYGIVDGIDYGIIRNTGLFSNMPSAVLATELMKGREDKACFGIDFNIVSGPSVSDPKTIPHLVDENGLFIRSNVRLADPRFKTEEGRREMFPYDEVYREIRAQYDRFVELTGRKPGYLHGHSLNHEHYNEAIHQVSEDSGVMYSADIVAKFPFRNLPEFRRDGVSMTKKFVIEDQLYKDTKGRVKAVMNDYLGEEYVQMGGHMGYIDSELLGWTSLSLERMRDLEMVMDPEIIKWVKDNDIQLITYYDLVEELKNR
ncbi:MAG: ChbG/HpnK family deacetylase [Erysipelotrichaceae bacterium]|nr:ChbG/HpnK family deacetylase [Erysipelotrichaceae bacterium]